MTLKYTLIIEGTEKEIQQSKTYGQWKVFQLSALYERPEVEFKVIEEQKKRRYKTLEELVAMGHIKLCTTDAGVPKYLISPYVQDGLGYFTLAKGLVGTITTDTNPSLTVEV
jgi:hypothetical protein